VRHVTALSERLRREAAGGRVSHGPFLEPEEADAVLRAVRGEGVEAEAWGGYPGARRRALTARPEHVPEAMPVLSGWYVEGAGDPDEMRSAAIAAGVAPDALGDAIVHADGCTLIALTSAAMPATITVAGRRAPVEAVPVERVVGGSSKRLTVVVPALRVDVLGARAFGVSRTYFAKGVAAGRVRVNGRSADKRSEAGLGDEVWADGLGRFRVVGLQGATRKGNRRVELEVERG
jgi:RNA-binding protein YlmH